MSRVGSPENGSLAPWAGRETLVAFALGFLFWAAAAAVWPLTGSVVPWDSKNHFYPMLRYLGAALEHGELPLWNPYHFSGHPSVADPQSLLFTPTMLLFGWLVPQPSMEAFDLAVFAHFLPGAAGILLLFRRRGWHWAGALLAVMIFILGGSASARLQHTGIIFSYGLFPLALWALEEALHRRSYAFGALFAVVAAMMTVGRDQVAFLSALALIAVVAHQAWDSGRIWPYLRARIGLLLAMGVIGGALLAIPTLLTMQFLMTSTRPSFGFGVAAMGSLPPASLATLLFSDIFGSVRWTYDYWGPDFKSLGGTTWTDRATNYLFMGTVPALLLLWHGIAGGRLLAREVRYFAILGLVALIYALGRYTPVFEFIFDAMPGVALYRRPSDATFLVNTALACAAGYLADRYIREGAPPLVRTRLAMALAGAALAAVLAALAAAFAYAVPVAKLGPALMEAGLGLGIVGAAGLLILRGGVGLRPRLAVAALLVAFTGGELIWRNAGSSLNAEPAERYAVFQQLPPEQLQGLQALKTELAARHAKGERPRVEILGLKGAWQNASMVLGIEDTLGYNPLRLADYERAIGPGENAVDPNLRQFPGLFRGYRCQLASLLGLEYLVLDRPLERLPKHFPRLVGSHLIYGSGTMWVYRLNPTAPRAYLATRVLPVDSESLLDEDELPDFDRTAEVLIDEASMPVIRGDYGRHDAATVAGPAKATVAIADYSRNAVRLTVETDQASIVVLHDIHYPGWEVSVNGKRRPLLRANLLFRGVEVPAGRHVVEFAFRPLSVDNLVAAASGLVADEEGAEKQP